MLIRVISDEIWRGKVVNVVNADKNYIGSDFEKALDVPVKFDIELPYDEQVELSEIQECR